MIYLFVPLITNSNILLFLFIYVRRMPMIVAEIVAFQPDIILLQEVKSNLLS